MTTQLPKLDLSLGDAGGAVLMLQNFLHRFGYARLSTQASPASGTDLPVLEPGSFDANLETALRSYQERNGLLVTGTLDADTNELLSAPRCGVPDPSAGGAFVVAGRWSRTSLTFGFENFTPDLPAEQVRTAIRQALQLWSDVTPLRFREVPLQARPNIIIRFKSGAHGFEIFAPFDGPGGVLAHAYYPESGEVHFDEDENWSVDVPPSGVDLVEVAAHEFGHALGLDHSQTGGAIMWPSYTYGSARRSLHPDDVEGIQFIYGRPPTSRAVATPPVAIANQDGRLEVFALSSENRLVHWWQTALNTWASSWDQLGTPRLQGRLAVTRNADGRIEVFGRGQDDNNLWHIWQTAPNNGWSSWDNLGGVWTSDPAVAANHDGRLEVFIRGTEGQVWHRNQMWAGGNWSPGYGSLGQALTAPPAVTRLPSGQLQIFVRGGDRALYTRWQTSPGGGWSDWQKVTNGTYSAAPAAFVDGPGTVHVLARGDDGALWGGWGRGGGASWGGPFRHGGRLAEGAVPVAVINKFGGLEMFARFDDGQLWHRWQVPAPAYWSDWATLGGPITSDPTVTTSFDGRIEVFAHQDDITLYHRWQHDNGSWN